MMIKFLTGKPVSVIMVYAALLLLGLAAINRMPVSPLPPIEVPEISIQLYKKNASAAVIDQQVITPLRNWLQEVHGMVGFKSVARNESGLITIRFRFDTDIDLAVMEVNEKLDLAMSSLPRDIERPHVIKSSTADLPVFYIDMSYLSAKDTSVSKRLELSDFAEQTVKKRFEQLLGVAFVDITGLEKPEVEIIIDPVSIAAMQLKPADLKRELASLQLGGSSFQINDRGYEYNIRLEAPSLSSLNDLKQLLIKKGGRVFRLKDIATIHFIPQSAKGAFFFNGKRAVRMAILKHPDSEMDNLRSDVQKVMEDLRKDYPEIETQVTQDQTRLLEFSILNLKQDLIFGSLAACLLMAFFLRDLKAPLLIVLTIPVCLIVSLLFFNIFHLTINIISLSGLVLGVGLMVDNTIIVIDSITHFRKLNEGLAEACVNGVGQVIKPLITSAITTSSVFVPLVFLSGMAGALFFDQAVAIGICLAVSLAVSTTLLPVLYLLVYRKLDRRQLPAVSNGGNGGSFLSAYEKGFDWMFRYKRASIGIVVLLLGINVLIFRSLKKEKLPDLRQTDLQVDINWNAPVPLETKIRHAKKIILGLNEMVVQTHIEAGNQQYLLNNAQGSDKAETTLYLSLKPGVSPEIARLAIRRLIRAAYPRASYSVAPVKDIFEQIFESHEPDLVVQIRQLNGERVSPAFSSAFTGDLKKHFPAAVISDAGARSTTVIRADMEKAMLYDLEIEDIYEALREHAEGS
jgi:multidrug efflux pump subunit AcrB